jgi:hypothetical protein
MRIGVDLGGTEIVRFGAFRYGIMTLVAALIPPVVSLMEKFGS